MLISAITTASITAIPTAPCLGTTNTAAPTYRAIAPMEFARLTAGQPVIETTVAHGPVPTEKSVPIARIDVRSAASGMARPPNKYTNVSGWMMRAARIGKEYVALQRLM